MNEAVLQTEACTAFEEPVHLYINRPLAGFIVDWLMKTPVTPNAVTMLGVLIGISAGVFFAQGSNLFLYWGAVLAQISFVLDCADGQLARRKQMSSNLGRILDGFGDYAVGMALFGGVIIGLGQGMDQGIISQFFAYPSYYNYWFIVLAALSAGLHSASYDFFKIKYVAIVEKGVDFAEQQRQDRLEQKKRYAAEGASFFKRLFFGIYSLYSDLQFRFFRSSGASKLAYTRGEREAIYKEQKGLFRMWSRVGPGSHFVLLVLGALLGDVMLAVFVLLVPMNIYFVILSIYTRRQLLRQPQAS